MLPNERLFPGNSPARQALFWQWLGLKPVTGLTENPARFLPGQPDPLESRPSRCFHNGTSEISSNCPKSSLPGRKRRGGGGKAAGGGDRVRVDGVALLMMGGPGIPTQNQPPSSWGQRTCLLLVITPQINSDTRCEGGGPRLLGAGNEREPAFPGQGACTAR